MDEQELLKEVVNFLNSRQLMQNFKDFAVDEIGHDLEQLEKKIEEVENEY